jgi:N6-L-threonylcarbamoyladenine synthase
MTAHAPVAGAGRLVLAIESSCDDTSVAILEDGVTLRSHLIAGQDVHKLYGGVVPELASRAHLDLLPPMVARAFDEAGVAPRELTGVAVTNAPGSSARSSWAWRSRRPTRPRWICPRRREPHRGASAFGLARARRQPVARGRARGLGGHTELVEVKGLGTYRWLGATLDDAAGEAYDKVAKRMGLGFPGGPILDRLAATGRPDAFAFPRPMLDRPGCDFSFSGLKTAVHTLLLPHGEPPYPDELLRDVAASFQAAVVETLVAKARRAIRGDRRASPQSRRRRRLQPRVACGAGRDVRAAGGGAAHPVAAAVRRQRRDDRVGRGPSAGPRGARRGRTRRRRLARGLGAAAALSRPAPPIGPRRACPAAPPTRRGHWSGRRWSCPCASDRTPVLPSRPYETPQDKRPTGR